MPLDQGLMLRGRTSARTSSPVHGGGRHPLPVVFPTTVEEG